MAEKIAPVNWRILQLKDITRSGVLIRGGGDVVNISPALGTRRWSWRWGRGGREETWTVTREAGRLQDEKRGHVYH